MNKKMKKFIKILKSISLSQKEKDVLRYKIEQFISFNPIRNEIHIPKKSFYFSVFTFRTLAKGVSLVLIALIVVGGTGVSYASTDALPGDRLYNVKINVNEKIEEKLAMSTQARVTVQTQRVERRLTEVQKLVERKDLSPERKEIVRVNLERNVSEVARTIENLKNEGRVEKALDTASRITPVLEAHKKVLTEQKQTERKDTRDSNENIELDLEINSFASFETMDEEQKEEYDSLLETVKAAIQKVEEVENRVIEKVNEDQKTAEEMTARNTEEVTRKLETLKKENIEIEIKAQNEKDILVETKVETRESEIKTIETLSAEKMETSAQDNLPVPAKATVVEPKIVSQTDAEIKVKEAEELLKKAEAARSEGKFREALILSQNARKIIQLIEEYKKIKSAETSTEIKVEKTQTQTSSVNTAPTVSSTETKIETRPSSVEVKTGTEVRIEGSTSTETKNELTNPIDIKAEAIKSIEETSASLKKLNLSQSIQTRLLP